MSDHDPFSAHFNSILCVSPTHSCVGISLSFEYDFDGVLDAKSFDRGLMPLNGYKGPRHRPICRLSPGQIEIGEFLQ